jgi:hypothetical protein
MSASLRGCFVVSADIVLPPLSLVGRGQLPIADAATIGLSSVAGKQGVRQSPGQGRVSGERVILSLSVKGSDAIFAAGGSASVAKLPCGVTGQFPPSSV